MRQIGQKPLASPAVRRRAWDLGIELQFVPGSGPAGRITQEDMEAYAASGARPAAPGTGLGRRDGVEEVPIVGLRRAIAEHLQQSKRHIPHFSYIEEVDVTALEELRAELNARRASRGHLTLLPFLVRAIVDAVAEHPQVNARFDDEAGVLLRHNAVHAGIATQTEGGLLVPVLHHAEAFDLWQAADEISRLADVARAGKATREELTGSTITVTSLGALGGLAATPVINYPEVAIVGVNRIAERPVVRDGQIVIRKMMNLSSSFDHRIVDGLNKGVGGLLDRAKVRVVPGWAVFSDAKTCRVETADGVVDITAEHVVLATGSEPAPLAVLTFGGNVISSTEALSLDELPQSLAIIGAGYIGLELGIAFKK